VERRNFLAAASVNALVAGQLARLAYAQRDSSTIGSSSESAAFKSGEVDVAGNKIFIAAMGRAPQFY
jgi:hypothetical protein